MSRSGRAAPRPNKKRARISRPASLLQVAWSKPPVGGKPILEGVDQGPEQGVLSLPLMLELTEWVYEVVVGEHVMIGIVMPIFRTHQQSGDRGHFVGEGLGEFPKRLLDSGARAIFVVEEFAAGGGFPCVPVVYDVLREALPRRTVVIGDVTGLTRVEILAGQRQIRDEGRLVGENRIDRAAI